MPNHIHGIITITNMVGATQASPLRGMAQRGPQAQSSKPRGPKPKSVGTIVGSFKSAVTKHINEMHHTPGAKLWQRNYYEHIVRNETELNRIREYIINNPLKWELDRENPSRSEQPQGGASSNGYNLWRT